MRPYAHEVPEMPIPGLTEAESLEYYKIRLEGMVYGYHSLTEEKLLRLEVLDGKVQ